MGWEAREQGRDGLTCGLGLKQRSGSVNGSLEGCVCEPAGRGGGSGGRDEGGGAANEARRYGARRRFGVARRRGRRRLPRRMVRGEARWRRGRVSGGLERALLRLASHLVNQKESDRNGTRQPQRYDALARMTADDDNRQRETEETETETETSRSFTPWQHSLARTRTRDDPL